MLKKSYILFFIFLLNGCATPLVLEKDYDLIKPYGYDKSEIIDVSYCEIVFPNYITVGTCVLTDKELALYSSKKLGSNIDTTKIKKHKYSEIRKVATKKSYNSLQMQVLAKDSYFAISAAPNSAQKDNEKTLEWFESIVNKGVSTFEAENYMRGPVKIYQVIYK